MGQGEWELWIGKGLGSYCPFHKCDGDSCDRGVKIDENDRIFNMCRYHCDLYEKKKASGDGETKRFSVSKFMETVFSSSRPRPEVVVQGILPEAETGSGRQVRCPQLCTDIKCERLQIVDSKGNVGLCEIHTACPVLEGLVEEQRSVPPVARRTDIGITGERLGSSTPGEGIAAAVDVVGSIATVLSG
ncbi:hypothetical protein FGG08_004324 [Glutinoglossum americanum]|uniref:Uncharacterized protein n=1 Tax=Glutinoglossum americanum TaxID=1670608 RepID=A0A9P8I5E0_9PEZI|nr:hypothetical protein FGG08_004324 [Glutinoglossum americanum]